MPADNIVMSLFVQTGERSLAHTYMYTLFEVIVGFVSVSVTALF